MRASRPARAAVAALIVGLGAGAGAGASVAGAQQASPAAFCEGAANLADFGEMFDTDAPPQVIIDQLQSFADAYSALTALAPPEIADDVALLSNSLSQVVDAIDAIDPSLPEDQQAAQLQAALAPLQANLAALQAAAVEVRTFIEANCVPAGGVAAGFGGTSGSSRDAAPYAAAAGVTAIAAAAWLMRRRPATAG
jgi:hypothetical protein